MAKMHCSANDDDDEDDDGDVRCASKGNANHILFKSNDIFVINAGDFFSRFIDFELNKCTTLIKAPCEDFQTREKCNNLCVI